MTKLRSIARLVALAVVLAGALLLVAQQSATGPAQSKAPSGKAAERRRARLAAKRQAPQAEPAQTPGSSEPTEDQLTGTEPPPAESTASDEAGSESLAGQSSSAAEPGHDRPSRPPADQSPLQVLRDETLAADVAGGELPIPPKIARYAANLLARYDTNGDGGLSESEWSRMQGNPRLADLNLDGWISRDELAGRIASYGLRRSLRLMPLATAGPAEAAPGARPGDVGSPPIAGTGAASAIVAALTGSRGEAAAKADARRRYFVPIEHLPKGLADWFVDNDADGDGQVTMSEFSASLSEADVLRFREYDLNGDGIITPQEFIGAEMTRRAEEEAKAAEAQLASPLSGKAPEATTP